MINLTTRPPLGGRVKKMSWKFWHLYLKGKRPSKKPARFLAGALSCVAALFFSSFASAQTSASLCLAITTSVNGVAVTSCVPVSATNPMPIVQTGTATATITAGTTPTSGFTAGQLLMSNGATVGPAGAAVGASLSLTGAMSALSYTANSLAGVSCAAASVSLTTLVVTNGIVTHC
jgi:hypothetical protein